MSEIKLTENELIVLKELAKGDTLKQIAQNLGKSYHSIHQFTRKLYQKLKVNNRRNLIIRALELKLLTYTAISKKFRDRFCIPPKTAKETIKLREPLTDEELAYFRLAIIQHYTKKQIIEKLNILNINFCNYIISNICYKLYARNLTQAAYHAGILGIL